MGECADVRMRGCADMKMCRCADVQIKQSYCEPGFRLLVKLSLRQTGEAERGHSCVIGLYIEQNI